MKKKIIIAGLIVVVACSIIAATIAYGDNITFMSAIGEALSDTQMTENSEEILATYNGNAVTKEMLDYQHSLAEYRTDKSYIDESDMDIINRILAGYIIIEEAEKAGLSATQEEISQMVSDAKNNYDSIPEIKSYLDEYCAAAKISIQQYFDAVEEQAFATITHLKYKNKFLEEFYNAYSSDNETYPADIATQAEDAYKMHRQELVNRHANEIVYSISQ